MFLTHLLLVVTEVDLWILASYLISGKIADDRSSSATVAGRV